ncbi:MAG: restriction endonuclease, partial [Capnocytophaga ochracea]
NIPEFHSFKYGDSLNKLSVEENLIEDKTPFERLEDIHQLLQDELAHDLLIKVSENSWQFFEDLVIDLMVKMGYGGAKSRKGNSVKRTNDEGIDGIINEDKLGLELIYLQAKKWDTETTIGRPEVQKFVGALHGQRAKKGVFITTSKFSDNAYEYVKTIDPKVVLIDGKTLTKLMIEYEIGTTVVENYQVKKIDTDYFEK